MIGYWRGTEPSVIELPRVAAHHCTIAAIVRPVDNHALDEAIIAPCTIEDPESGFEILGLCEARVIVDH
jgi:hypothetical protein